MLSRGSVMWGQGVYGAQLLVLVHKFTFKVVLGVIFSHRLSLLLNIQIEKSDNFDPQFLKLALPLVLSSENLLKSLDSIVTITNYNFMQKFH